MLKTAKTNNENLKMWIRREREEDNNEIRLIFIALVEADKGANTFPNWLQAAERRMEVLFLVEMNHLFHRCRLSICRLKNQDHRTGVPNEGVDDGSPQVHICHIVTPQFNRESAVGMLQTAMSIQRIAAVVNVLF